MDEIQKVLVKAGRKDLAQMYYEKVAEFLGGTNIVINIQSQKQRSEIRNDFKKVIEADQKDKGSDSLKGIIFTIKISESNVSFETYRANALRYIKKILAQLSLDKKYNLEFSHKETHPDNFVYIFEGKMAVEN